MSIVITIITLISLVDPFFNLTGHISALQTITQNPTEVEIKKTETQKIWVTVTAYSSTPEQTDDTPFITAKGTKVRDGIIAANFLDFDTKVKLPEIFGDKVFVVEDRMHPRFSDRIDIWFPDLETAKSFGKRHTIIEIES